MQNVPEQIEGRRVATDALKQLTTLPCTAPWWQRRRADLREHARHPGEVVAAVERLTLFRPPGTVVPGGLVFQCCFFVSDTLRRYSMSPSCLGRSP